MKKSVLSFLIIFLFFNTTQVGAFEYLRVTQQKESIISKVLRCKWRIKCYSEKRLGALTDLQSTDAQVDFPTLYNANLDNTLEVGTTSVASITTLSGLLSASSLATIGTITSGTWNGSLIPVAYGGTASSSTGTAYKIVLANGATGYQLVSDLGSSGQLLASNGSGAAPSWQSPAVDLTISYNWTGFHQFTTATGTILNAGTTTITSARIGIGTTSPSLASALNIGTPTYFGRGIGIGIATTTANTNVEIDGTLITSRHSSTTAFLLGYQRVSATQALTTTADADTSASVDCSAGFEVLSGGFTVPDGAASSVEYNVTQTYPSDSDTWSVTVTCHDGPNTGGSCAAGDLTVYAICADVRK